MYLYFARSSLYFLLVRGNLLQQFSLANISVYSGLSEHKYKCSNMRYKGNYLLMYKGNESPHVSFLYFRFLVVDANFNSINTHIGLSPNVSTGLVLLENATKCPMGFDLKRFLLVYENDLINFFIPSSLNISGIDQNELGRTI